MQRLAGHGRCHVVPFAFYSLANETGHKPLHCSVVAQRTAGAPGKCVTEGTRKLHASVGRLRGNSQPQQHPKSRRRESLFVRNSCLTKNAQPEATQPPATGLKQLKNG